jgi:hypothetical protein
MDLPDFGEQFFARTRFRRTTRYTMNTKSWCAEVPVND